MRKTITILYMTFFVCVILSGCVGPAENLNPMNPSSDEVSEISTERHSELSEITGTIETEEDDDVDSVEVTITNDDDGWMLEQVFIRDGSTVAELSYDGEEKDVEVFIEEADTDEEEEFIEPGDNELRFGETSIEEGGTVTVFLGDSLLTEERNSLVVSREDEIIHEEVDLEEEMELNNELEIDEGQYTASIVNVSEDTAEQRVLSEATENSTLAEDSAVVEFVEPVEEDGGDEGELPSQFEAYDATVFMDYAETLRDIDGSTYRLGGVSGGDRVAGHSTYTLRLNREDSNDRRVSVDRGNWYPLDVVELEEDGNRTFVSEINSFDEVEFEFDG